MLQLINSIKSSILCHKWLLICITFGLFSGTAIAQECTNVAADVAFGFSPEDGAVTPLISTSLLWTEGDCTTSSQLYFGTNPTPSEAEYQGQQTSPWTPPEELAFETTYFWQVVTFNNDGPDTVGPVLSFTTRLTGACCAFIVDDTYCFQSPQEACDLFGDSTWYEGMACSEIICPVPTGACCVGTNCIDDILESQCLTFPGGLYYGDNTDCSEGICDSPPTGACCVEESCTTIPEADCATNGGTYQGSGTTCVDNPCIDPTGACCTEETCTVETTFDCLAGGGTYLGDGITCDDSPCEVGACCVTEVCVEVTEEKCAIFNGLYQNDGTSCDDDPCALLDPSGACCVDDDVECITETEASCLGIGGVFQGDNTTCSDTICDPTGACCVDSTCQIEQEAACEDAGGTYQGDDTSCEEHTCDQLGACCIDEICIEMYESECDEFIDGEYLGDGASCSTSPCVTRLTGACCVGETCSILSQSDCLSASGTYQGDDITCDDEPCAIPRGACCALEMCIPDSPLEACDALGGMYLGDDSTCVGDPCASPVTVGACCIGSTCATVTESNCVSEAGTYQGDGSVCIASPCEPPSPTGACCINETCTVITEDSCISENGEYQGNNTSCTTDQCAIGACCANEHCYENLKRSDCLEIDGEYEGVGTTCTTEPCTPEVTGFCCVNDGYLCMEIPETSCSEFSGTFGGDGSECGESTCDPISSGACCVGGACVWRTEASCVGEGGVYTGDNTTCLDVSCQSTPTPTGSCCNADTCSIQTSAVCVGLGGTYFGDNTQCMSTTCEVDTGACCVEEVCARSLQNDCETAGGTYHIGATCEEIACATLACCIETTCIEMSQTFCDAFGGIAFGDGTDCVTEECAEQPEAIVGACCVLGSECITGITSEACQQTGGSYLGDNTSCSGTSCEDEQTHPQRPIVPEEACVSETITLEAPDQSYFEYDWQSRDPGDLTWDNLPGGQFTVQVTVHEEGLWVFQYRQRAQGDSWSEWVVLAGQTMVTDCDPTGACCVDGECSETTAALCEGAFLGDWTVCGSNSCDPSDGSATGACCTDGSCSVVSIGDCVGNYFGDGTDCSTDFCEEVVGSCCLDDTCFRVTFETCVNEGGMYRGDYSLCWENPCDAVMLGACCLGSECHETTEEACVGQWAGANTVCEEETCEDGDTIIGPFQWTIEEGGNDHWYAIVVSGAICWDEANTEALADGAYLLSVTTVDELAWWLSTFAGTGQEPLIGLHQLAGSAEPSEGWEWSNGEGDTLQNWAAGSPDDATGESNVAQLFSSGYWDDVLGCGATSYAIEYGQWYNVCETCEYQTIQAAVNDASSTETIYVDAGIYTSVDGTSLVDLQGKNISIIGKGASQTILDGQHAVSGLRYSLATGETSTIQGVTIKDCVGGDGPAITVSGGELVLINTALLDNVASGNKASGGAILASGGVSLVVQGSEFSRNSAVTFGGAILLTDSGTTAQITDCLFGENESFYGGAIYVSDATACTVDLVEFTNNTAAVDGGAASITGDGSSFTSCCFRGNVAGNVGGAIDNRIGADTLLSESIFANNIAVYEGGALYNNSSSPYVYTCTFASNSSSEENGGGIHNDNDSMPSIEATLFCGNTGRGGSESTLEGHIYPTVADIDYEFVGGNEFHALCSTCQGDVNGDGIIDLSDLLAIAMLSVWGECNDCLADLDNNGVVDPDDIVILIELLTSRLDHPCDVECPYRF